MNPKTNILSASCPMPKMDFDIITLGHGSGGLLTNKLLESGVFNLFRNEYLDQKHDGAILSLPGQVAFSTDSYVISPIFFPGGNIGELAVNGTVNDLAMCGAKAKYLSLSFIIEEGLRMDDFWEILLSIKAAAEKAQVLIVTGDTKVVERGKGDKIFINTSGIGIIHPEANISTHNVKAGDKIIVSGQIATHGIAIMSVREGLDFETSIESDTCHFNDVVTRILDQFGHDIHLFRDPTRGGVATVLNEIARDSNLGIDIDQKYIKVSDDVAGACELLGLDPLYVANEGVFIAVVNESKVADILAEIQTWEHGQDAFIIGEVVESHPRQVIINSAIGGKRVVNMLLGEQLPRIC
jgi:hydrogenase expression/formation protein HypE